MIFLANRANLDKRTLLTRLHTNLRTRVENEGSPVQRVWYRTAAGNKAGVRARVDAPSFLDTSYAVSEAELHVSFDFPPNYEFDWYRIQWVEPERQLMVGWHQDETHTDLGECHLQVDFEGETVQRVPGNYLDTHPLNVFDRRMTHLPAVITALTWEDGRPTVPDRATR